MSVPVSGVFFLLGGIVLNPIVREKLKLKRWIAVVLSLFLIFVGGAAAPDQSAEAEPESEVIAQEQEEPEEAEKPAVVQEELEQPEESEAPESENLETPGESDDKAEDPSEPSALDGVMTSVQDSLEENFAGNYSFSYDETGAILDIWSDGIAAGVAAALNGDRESQEAWGELLYNLSQASEAIYETAESVGYTEYTVGVNVLNDQNKDAMLAMILNGEIVYTAADYILPGSEESLESDAEQQEMAPEEQSAEEQEEIIVYITDTGTKYHRGSCRHLKKSKIETTLEKAKSNGYEPCGTCNPPT